MSQQDRQLVDLITREVLRLMRERGQSPQQAGGGGSGDKLHAEVHPPIGVCTGDYSKFPELAGRAVGAPPPGATSVGGSSPASADAMGAEKDTGGQAATPGSGAHALPPVLLSGIITANQLQAALDRAAGGAVTLAGDARLTPLANDLARQQARRVNRAAPGNNPGASPAASPADLPWLWWIDGHCPVVQEVTAQQRERLRPSGAGSRPSALPQVVREIASAIRGKTAAGAVLFVHNAARAMCMANRCPSLRAVVGTCGEAVEQGITEIGANVLVIEYPHHGLRSTSAMVERMLQQPPRVPPAVERELADLARCG